MSDETYNGWENYETWAVNLHLDNEEWSQREVQRIVRRAKSIGNAADELREFVDGNILVDENGEALTSQASLMSDLLCKSLNRVNWYEIAENSGWAVGTENDNDDEADESEDE